jgi:hypothetical protein
VRRHGDTGRIPCSLLGTKETEVMGCLWTRLISCAICAVRTSHSRTDASKCTVKPLTASHFLPPRRRKQRTRPPKVARAHGRQLRAACTRLLRLHSVHTSIEIGLRGGAKERARQRRGKRERAGVRQERGREADKERRRAGGRAVHSCVCESAAIPETRMAPLCVIRASLHDELQLMLHVGARTHDTRHKTHTKHNDTKTARREVAGRGVAARGVRHRAWPRRLQTPCQKSVTQNKRPRTPAAYTASAATSIAACTAGPPTQHPPKAAGEHLWVTRPRLASHSLMRRS